MFGGFARENDLREHILELIRIDTTLSQKRVAKESGCNEGALNQWLHAKPPYETHPLTAEKLMKWLDARERRRETRAPFLPLPPTPPLPQVGKSWPSLPMPRWPQIWPLSMV